MFVIFQELQKQILEFIVVHLLLIVNDLYEIFTSQIIWCKNEPNFKRYVLLEIKTSTKLCIDAPFQQR